MIKDLKDRIIAQKTLQIDIVSAEREIHSGSASRVVVRAEEGEMGIFPGHAPLLAMLKPGEVRVVDADNQENYFYVSGGFIEVQPQSVTILADTVLRATEIDEKKAMQAKEEAEKILASRHEDVNYRAALIEFTKAVAQLRVAKRGQK
jgi:F-type H+-transporting ATPase subunit epsilon